MKIQPRFDKDLDPIVFTKAVSFVIIFIPTVKPREHSGGYAKVRLTRL